MNRDYSQDGDPYGIAAEYSSQSPEFGQVPSARRTDSVKSSITPTEKVKLPTQEEADAVWK